MCEPRARPRYVSRHDASVGGPDNPSSDPGKGHDGETRMPESTRLSLGAVIGNVSQVPPQLTFDAALVPTTLASAIQLADGRLPFSAASAVRSALEVLILDEVASKKSWVRNASRYAAACVTVGTPISSAVAADTRGIAAGRLVAVGRHKPSCAADRVVGAKALGNSGMRRSRRIIPASRSPRANHAPCRLF